MVTDTKDSILSMIAPIEHREGQGLTDIVIRGAREHNLQNLTLKLPRQSLIVITGVSGSGKSSLAFDTLYAEGQRRYVESLSAYARQFLGQMEKPEVDAIEGLSPAIAIEQRSAGSNPRSTVATITEVYDYLRLLFARLGVQYCVKCGTRLARQSVEEMVDQILAQAGGQRPARDHRARAEGPVPAGDGGGPAPGLPARTRRRGMGRARSAAQAGALEAPRRRDRGGSRDRRREVARAARRLHRGGAQAGRGHDVGLARRRPRSGLQSGLGVPQVRHQRRSGGAAQLLVQPAVRRLQDLRWARHHAPGRSAARGARSRQESRGRRGGGVGRRGGHLGGRHLARTGQGLRLLAQDAVAQAAAQGPQAGPRRQ